MSMLLFFFQAEDGIRDLYVTGVQTCALPICPVVVVAYTIKGWGLPFQGDPLNHSMLLTPAQIDALRAAAGVPAGDEFAGFAPGSPEWRLLHRDAAPSPPAPAREIPEPPAALPETYAGRIAT